MADSTTHWLVQRILYDEIVTKVQWEDPVFIDRLAWNYTQYMRKYVPCDKVVEALEIIRKILELSIDNHQNWSCLLERAEEK